MSHFLLVRNANQLLSLRGEGLRRGQAMSDLGMIRGGAVLIRNEKIVAVGPATRIERLPEARRAQEIDAKQGVVLPGFVDSHTHLVFPASRTNEYEMRIHGASYEEIARAGGGILASARKLRRLPAARLAERARRWLREFAAHGTTTVEVKSGYGLDLKSEIKMLEVVRQLNEEGPLELVATFLGAHAVPAEYRRKPERYVEMVIQQMIPAVAARSLAEFCDVFCDRGGFTLKQARAILKAGRVCGLEPRLHAEQLTRTGACQLGVELRAASVDHLEKIGRRDTRNLGKSDTVATLLPGATFHLGRSDYAPGRELIDGGAAVALASDFNPGTSPTYNMGMILSLACTQMGMTPGEAIVAATVNAAYSLRRADRVGSLEPGKQADVAIMKVPDYREMAYYFGANHCAMTIKRGRIIYRCAS
ncbi:MAG TPA: imidazolonepropionase [Candidatus Acidoferrales bacterium]